MSEWISVEDKLPESEKEVIFYHNKEYHIGYYIERIFGRNDRAWFSNYEGINYNIKFWMPLPKPPGVNNET